MTMKRTFVALLWFLSLFANPAFAQFGINKKTKNTAATEESVVVDQQQQDDNNGGATTSSNIDVSSDWSEMMKDPEMAAAMEMFANMSPEEMQETMQELLGMFGNDPEMVAAIEEVLREVGNMDAPQLEQTMNDLMEEEELVGAMNNVLEQIANADNDMFDTILEKKDVILDSVIESGQISVQDAARFKSDPEAWENELKGIWTEVRKEAE